MSQASPQLTLLNEEQKDQVHAWSLRILGEPGVRVDSPAARKLLAHPGGCLVEGARVRMPPDLVTWALESAPAEVEIYDRLGRHAFNLGAGGNTTRFGIGVTNLYYQDPETDALAPFTQEHIALSTGLGHALAEYDVVSTVGLLADLPPESSDLYATLEMVANTTKPLVILTSDGAAMPRALDLLEFLCGQTATRLCVLPYVNPITPLVIDEGASQRIAAAIERGLPLIYSNYGMAGATTPITAAGTLALLNAELLAGLALAQLMRPGVPVVLGSLPASFDMRAMISYYGPQTMLLNMACAEMMAHYRLPHCGTSGSGSGWGPDLLASDLLWMNHLTSCLGCGGLAPFVGGNFASLAFSPATVVYGAEVIRQGRVFAAGFPLDDEMAGYDEITGAGADGNFLGASLTLRHFRAADPANPLWPRLSLEGWREARSPRAERLLRKRTVELMASFEPPADHDELLTAGEEFIRQTAHPLTDQGAFRHPLVR
jgi:trimethylamine---corrinoid protein Co-methyltransferase